MGSLNEFGWLAKVDVTSRWQATEILSHILLRLRLALLLVRFAQPAKVRLRSALVPPCAQNDMPTECWFSKIRKTRPPRKFARWADVYYIICYANWNLANRSFLFI